MNNKEYRYPKAMPVQSELHGLWAREKFRENYVLVIKTPKGELGDTFSPRMKYVTKVLANNRVTYDPTNRDDLSDYMFVPCKRFREAKELFRILTTGDILLDVTFYVEGLLEEAS